MKLTPKKSLGGDLLRTVISKHPDSEKSSSIGRSQEFQSDGYHSKPTTGKSAEGPSGAKRRSVEKKNGDFPFFKFNTKGK